MPLYIAKNGDLDRCYRCLTHSQTLKDSATQLLTKYKSGALVTQLYTRSRRYDTEGSRNDIYACCYARKTGWKFCPKKTLIRFSKTSQEIVAWEIEGGTDVNYHWTPAQEEVFLRHKRNALIFHKLREQNLVNGSGQLLTISQLGCKER